jgi:hypothetical protein
MTFGTMTLDIMRLGITTFIIPGNSVIIVNVVMLRRVAIFAMKQRSIYYANNIFSYSKMD